MIYYSAQLFSWQGKTATVLFAVTLNAGKAENAAALTLEQEAH
nr:hypothetical protein PGH06_23345 [Citrobacter braakii]